MHEYMIWSRGGPGAVVKAACLESQRFHGLKPHSFYFHLHDLASLCHVL